MKNKGVYTYLAQERVHFGKPAAEAVLEEVELRSAKRVLIVTGKTLANKTDSITKIERKLRDLHVGTYTGTVEHVPRLSVLLLMTTIRDLSPDLIVTIGGGTAIDTVKVALVGLAQNVKKASDFDACHIKVLDDGTAHYPKISSPPVRQIIIPTTLTGAEFSSLAGAVNEVTSLKNLYTGREIGGEAIILDPTLTIDTPEWLWLSTGIRSIDHAVETLCSRAPQPLTDSTCIGALGLLSKALRTTKQDPLDIEARLDGQMGVWLATTGLGRVPWGASHGIGHQLGAVANIPHGYCSCVMLPSVLKYNKEKTAEKQKVIAIALGRPNMDAGDAIRELVEDIGLPSRLRDVGISKDQFQTIADGSISNLFVSQNPRPINTTEQIIEILDMAW